MSFVIYSFSLMASVISIFSVILQILRRRKNNIVFHTQGFWFANIFGIYCSVMLSVFHYRNGENYIVFAFAMALVMILNLSFFNQVVVFDDGGFSVGNFLGFRRHYIYADITGFMYKTVRYRHSTETKTIFYTGDKKFSIETSAYNYHLFFDKVSTEYRKLNSGKKLPQFKNKT